MKRVIKLTESDLTRIVRKVINEGALMSVPLDRFPEGFYTLTKVEPDTVRDGQKVLVKNSDGLKIYSGNITFPKGVPTGSGSFYA
jgi:hypothetical protein